jgi:hypothetical protein
MPITVSRIAEIEKGTVFEGESYVEPEGFVDALLEPFILLKKAATKGLTEKEYQRSLELGFEELGPSPLGMVGGPKALGFKEAKRKFSALWDKIERFEFGTYGARLKEGFKDKIVSGRDVPLVDFLDFPELFKNYPEFKRRIKVRGAVFAGRADAKITPGWNDYGDRLFDIQFRKDLPDDEIMRSLLHEVQHAIQFEEGFAGGTSGSVGTFVAEKIPKDKRFFQRVVNAIRHTYGKKAANQSDEDIINYAKKHIDEYANWDVYSRYAGEAEAREATTRTFLGEAEKSAMQPLEHTGLRLDELIVEGVDHLRQFGKKWNKTLSFLGITIPTTILSTDAEAESTEIEKGTEIDEDIDYKRTIINAISDTLKGVPGTGYKVGKELISKVEEGTELESVEPLLDFEPIAISSMFDPEMIIPESQKDSIGARPQDIEISIYGSDTGGMDEDSGENKSILGTLFDYLQTGQYMTASMVEEGLKIVDDKGIKGFKDVSKALYEGKGDLAISAWKGLSHQNRASYIDILRERNFKHPFALGLMLDIGLDPITYVPFGLMIKPIKALGKTKVAQKVGKSKIVTKFGELFVPGKGLPRKYYESKLFAKYTAQADEMKVLDELGELAHGLRKSDRIFLSTARQRPELLEELTPFLHAKYQRFADEFEELGRLGVKEGLIPEESFIKMRDTYLPGFYPKGKSRMLGTDVLSGKVRKPFYSKGKTLGKDATLEEIDALARRLGREDWIPERDIAKLLGLEQIERVRYLAKKKFVNDTLSEFGIHIRAKDAWNIPEGMSLYHPKGAIRYYKAKTLNERKIRQYMLDQFEGLEFITPEMMDDALSKLTPEAYDTALAMSKKVETWLLPTEIAEDIDKVQRFFISDEATRWAINTFWKRPHVAWKGMATSARLPFHLRNDHSNSFLMWLMGVPLEKIAYRKSQALAVRMSQKWKKLPERLRKFVGKHGNIKLKDGTALTAEQVSRLAETHGIYGRGWMGEDVGTDILEELGRHIDGKPVTRFLKHPFRETLRGGRKFGMVIEDNARIGAFIDALVKGDDPATAARKVRKYLFDYGELTEFEQQVMKQIIPFYTWLRKNIPLQIQSLVEQPGKYASVGKTYDAASKKWEETIEDKMNKPDYFSEMMYVKTGWKTEDGSPLYLSVDLPYMEINRMFSFQQMLSSVTPAKFLLELALNTKTFPTTSKIERVEGFTKVPAPFYVAWLPDKIKKVIGAEPIHDPADPTNKILGIRAKYKYALEVMLPFLSEMDKMNPQPIRLEEKRKPWRILSYITGIKVMPRDEATEEMYRYFDQQKRLGEVADVMRNYDRQPTKEELKTIMERERK